jgi:hypothetical protein
MSTSSKLTLVYYRSLKRFNCFKNLIFRYFYQGFCSFLTKLSSFTYFF